MTEWLKKALEVSEDEPYDVRRSRELKDEQKRGATVLQAGMTAEELAVAQKIAPKYGFEVEIEWYVRDGNGAAQVRVSRKGPSVPGKSDKFLKELGDKT